MMLAIDIGNSLIKIGTFDGAELLDKITIPTKRNYSPDDLQFDRLASLRVDSVVSASVVPELIEVVREASQKHFHIAPTFIDHSTDFGLKIYYDPPESAGIDRLVDAFAAADKYGTPAIICSFGTATVIDAVSRDRQFLGGIIVPGVKTMAECLHQTTAKLPAVDIKEPKSLLGNSTESAILSGIVNGHIAMVEGLIASITSNSELGTPNSELNVIATGGFAALIGSKIAAVTQIDDNLTLDGLRILAERM